MILMHPVPVMKVILVKYNYPELKGRLTEKQVITVVDLDQLIKHKVIPMGVDGYRPESI